MTHPDEATDITLVAEARNGDEHAFALLIERYDGDLRRILRKKGIKEGELDDLLQDTYEAAFRNLSRLQKNESFKGWICTIAKNKAHDHHRRGKRFLNWKPFSLVLEKDPQMEPASDRLNFEELFCRQELVEHTFAYGLEYYPKPFTCLHLYVCGRTRQEISQTMQIGYGSVQTYLSHARKLFRTLYNRFERGVQ
jgi:RNA polymerase sigma-70 factor (ECF subfamily)